MTDSEHLRVKFTETKAELFSDNGPQRADVSVPDAHNHPGAHFLAPLLPTPTEQCSEKSNRGSLLRRALTLPWRQLVASQGPQQPNSRGGAERSCHAFGSAPRPAAAIRPDASVPGRIDRRESGSVASHRSRFTIDGLPEAPDPALPAIYPDDLRAAPAGDASSSGSGRQASRPHVAYDAGQCAGVPSAPPLMAALQYQQQHPQHQRPIHQCYPDGIQTRIQNSSSDPSLQRRGGDGPSSHTPRAPSPLTIASAGSTLGDGQRGLQAQLQPHPPPPPQQQQQPQCLYGASLGPGDGPMHDLLQRPGGTDAFVHSIKEAAAAGRAMPGAPYGGGGGGGAQSAERLLALHPLEGSGGAVLPATASTGTSSKGGGGGAATADLSAKPPQPPAAGPSFLDWDDVRNPMSFNYDPSMDTKLQQQQQRMQQQQQQRIQRYPTQGCTGSQKGGNANASVHDRSAAAGVANGGAVGGGGAVDRTVDRTLGGDGVNGVEVVAANGPVVVLEMKGPRGTPTTHTAAMAAFMSGASASPAAPDAAAAAAGMQLTLRGRMASYFSKWRGVGDTLMPADHPIDILWSWLGAFLSILVVAVLNQYLTPQVSLPLMIASFGASAVLLFGVPASKLAQPRNFLGGQVVSAIVGVLVRLAFMKAPDLVWLSSALGMSLALVAMQLTRTVHPPGGASALIASSVPYIGPWYGFKFVLTVFFGSVAMLVVAVLVNNLSARRRYPTYWVGK